MSDDPKAEPGRAVSLENDIFPQLIAQGQRFAGLECPGAFIDIGVPHDYQRAASVLPMLPNAEFEEHDHAIAG
jgi:NDP-sugar pyrophosphorylase family protein